jgi:nitroimidazol reductase NimA-like FMN-containing flavoprotein (pyridoxamine 5'-phosphate oxidase superfamily)
MRLGRLACVRDSQPYVTPFHFCFHDGHIYSFATIGQKIMWMRDNPRVCVEVDEIKSPQQWTCVIAFGRFEELPNSPEWRQTRQMVHDLLEKHGNWWQPGFARTVIGGEERPLVPVFFRIFVEQMTGRRASLDAEEFETVSSPIRVGGWLRKLIQKS